VNELDIVHVVLIFGTFFQDSTVIYIYSDGIAARFIKLSTHQRGKGRKKKEPKSKPKAQKPK
jgi:hypothetical protein